jgi:hypothetical protein
MLFILCVNIKIRKRLPGNKLSSTIVFPTLEAEAISGKMIAKTFRVYNPSTAGRKSKVKTNTV